MDLAGMKRRELQALCKRHGLSAGGTNADLVARLDAELSGAADAEEEVARVPAKKGCLKQTGGDAAESKKVTFAAEEVGRARRLRSRVIWSPIVDKRRGKSAQASTDSAAAEDGISAEVGAIVPLRRSRRNSVIPAEAEEVGEAVAVGRKRKRKNQEGDEGVAAVSAQVGVSARVTRRSSLARAAVALPPAVEKKRGRGKAAGGSNKPVAEVQDSEPDVQKSAQEEVPARVTRSRSIAPVVISPNAVENKRRRKTGDARTNVELPTVSDVPRNEAPVTRSLRNTVVQVSNSMVDDTHTAGQLESKTQPSRPPTRRHQQVSSSVVDKNQEQVAAPNKAPVLRRSGRNCPEDADKQPAVKEPVRRSTRKSVVPATLEKEENDLIEEKNTAAHVRRSTRKSIVPVIGENIHIANREDVVKQPATKGPVRVSKRKSVVPEFLGKEKGLISEKNVEAHEGKPKWKPVLSVKDIEAFGKGIQNTKGKDVEKQFGVKQPTRRSSHKSVLPDMLENKSGLLAAEMNAEMNVRRSTRKSVVPNINEENPNHNKVAINKNFRSGECQDGERQKKVKEPIRRSRRSVAAVPIEEQSNGLHEEKTSKNPMRRSTRKSVVAREPERVSVEGLKLRKHRSSLELSSSANDSWRKQKNTQTPNEKDNTGGTQQTSNSTTLMGRSSKRRRKTASEEVRSVKEANDDINIREATKDAHKATDECKESGSRVQESDQVNVPTEEHSSGPLLVTVTLPDKISTVQSVPVVILGSESCDNANESSDKSKQEHSNIQAVDSHLSETSAELDQSSCTAALVLHNSDVSEDKSLTSKDGLSIDFTIGDLGLEANASNPGAKNLANVKSTGLNAKLLQHDTDIIAKETDKDVLPMAFPIDEHGEKYTVSPVAVEKIISWEASACLEHDCDVLTKETAEDVLPMASPIEEHGEKYAVSSVVVEKSVDWDTSACESAGKPLTGIFSNDLHTKHVQHGCDVLTKETGEASGAALPISESNTNPEIQCNTEESIQTADLGKCPSSVSKGDPYSTSLHLEGAAADCNLPVLNADKGCPSDRRPSSFGLEHMFAEACKESESGESPVSGEGRVGLEANASESGERNPADITSTDLYAKSLQHDTDIIAEETGLVAEENTRAADPGKCPSRCSKGNPLSTSLHVEGAADDTSLPVLNADKGCSSDGRPSSFHLELMFAEECEESYSRNAENNAVEIDGGNKPTTPVTSGFHVLSDCLEDEVVQPTECDADKKPDVDEGDTEENFAQEKSNDQHVPAKTDLNIKLNDELAGPGEECIIEKNARLVADNLDEQAIILVQQGDVQEGDLKKTSPCSTTPVCKHKFGLPEEIVLPPKNTGSLSSAEQSPFGLESLFSHENIDESMGSATAHTKDGFDDSKDCHVKSGLESTHVLEPYSYDDTEEGISRNDDCMQTSQQDHGIEGSPDANLDEDGQLNFKMEGAKVGESSLYFKKDIGNILDSRSVGKVIPSGSGLSKDLSKEVLDGFSMQTSLYGSSTCGKKIVCRVDAIEKVGPLSEEAACTMTNYAGLCSSNPRDLLMELQSLSDPCDNLAFPSAENSVDESINVEQRVKLHHSDAIENEGPFSEEAACTMKNDAGLFSSNPRDLLMELQSPSDPHDSLEFPSAENSVDAVEQRVKLHHIDAIENEGPLSEEAACTMKNDAGLCSSNPRDLLMELQSLSDPHDSLAFPSAETSVDESINVEQRVKLHHSSDLSHLDELIGCSNTEVLCQGHNHKDRSNMDRVEQVASESCKKDIVESAATAKCIESGLVLPPSEERSNLIDAQLNPKLGSPNIIVSSLNSDKDVCNTSDNGSTVVVVGERTPSGSGLPETRQELLDGISVDSSLQGTTFGKTIVSGVAVTGNLSSSLATPGTSSVDPRHLVMDLQFLFSEGSTEKSDQEDNLASPSAESGRDEPHPYQDPCQDLSRHEEKETCMSVPMQAKESGGFLKSNHTKDSLTSVKIDLADDAHLIERDVAAAVEVLCEEKMERQSMPISDSDTLQEKSYSNGHGICQSRSQKHIVEANSRLSSCGTEVLHQDHKEECNELNEGKFSSKALVEKNMTEDAAIEGMESSIILPLVAGTSEIPNEQLNTKMSDKDTIENFCTGPAKRDLYSLPEDFHIDSCQEQEVPEVLSLPKSPEESAEFQSVSVLGPGPCQQRVNESTSMPATYNIDETVNQDHEEYNQNNEDQTTSGVSASSVPEQIEIEQSEMKIGLIPATETPVLLPVPDEQPNSKLEGNEDQITTGVPASSVPEAVEVEQSEMEICLIPAAETSLLPVPDEQPNSKLEGNEDQITAGIPTSSVPEAVEIEQSEKEIGLMSAAETSALLVPDEQPNSKLESNEVHEHSCSYDKDFFILSDSESLKREASSLNKDDCMDLSSEDNHPNDLPAPKSPEPSAYIQNDNESDSVGISQSSRQSGIAELRAKLQSCKVSSTVKGSYIAMSAPRPKPGDIMSQSAIALLRNIENTPAAKAGHPVKPNADGKDSSRRALQPISGRPREH